MASVKVKFRPSSVNGKEGSIYYQVIHDRAVRQIKTDCRIFETSGTARHRQLQFLFWQAMSVRTTCNRLQTE